MRNIKQFITDLIKKPPMIFPFIGGFHLFWLVRTALHTRAATLTSDTIQLAWMTGYTLFWLAMCDLRKWGAWGYMILTAVDLGLFFLPKSAYDRDLYTSSLLGMNVVFCLFILLYFKRFNKVRAVEPPATTG
jgi:hypothetical protein